MTETLLQIPLGELQIDPDQPRIELEGNSSDTEFTTLKGLTTSIEKVGLLQPLRVQRLADGKYQILSGHRRFEAAKGVKDLHKLPCIVVDSPGSAQTVRLAQITENVQRKAMTSRELAWSVQELLRLGLDQAEVATKLGVTESQISVLSRLNRLSPLVRQAFHDNHIKSPRAAYDLDRLSPTQQSELIALCAEREVKTITQKDVQDFKDLVVAAQGQAQHDPLRAPEWSQTDCKALMAILNDDVAERYSPKRDRHEISQRSKSAGSGVARARAPTPELLNTRQDARVRLPSLTAAQAHRLVGEICRVRREVAPEHLSADQHPSAESLARWLSVALQVV